MKLAKEIRKALLAAVWLVVLTFPLMVIKVNTIEKTIVWRWYNLILVGAIGFPVALAWFYFLKKRELTATGKNETGTVRPANHDNIFSSLSAFLRQPRNTWIALGSLLLMLLAFPFLSSMYLTNIMSTALMYVMLGLGLNIVVGLGGLLNLGYIAFYAVGAYTYALLNHHFGLNFWFALPLGGLMAMLFGLLLGFPVLRLRGDYLAIVTLAFGEILRLVLENWGDFSFGPSGIANIPRPPLFGLKLNLQQAAIYIYYLMIGLTIITIFVINRLQDSRLGRAWVAMREDEIASQSMGIDLTKMKLASFAIGAAWAGLAGVMFAAKTTFINPSSFTIWESVTVLCIVVLGGMGSIPGVVLAAFIFTLLSEVVFRAFAGYRMLIFGAALVVMMQFRPGGIIPARRKLYQSQAAPVQAQDRKTAKELSG